MPAFSNAQMTVEHDQPIVRDAAIAEIERALLEGRRPLGRPCGQLIASVYGADRRRRSKRSATSTTPMRRPAANYRVRVQRRLATLTEQVGSWPRSSATKLGELTVRGRRAGPAVRSDPGSPRRSAGAWSASCATPRSAALRRRAVPDRHVHPDPLPRVQVRTRGGRGARRTTS